jgi:hypothetical protein
MMVMFGGTTRLLDKQTSLPTATGVFEGSLENVTH